jgi:hypothetical protein
MALRRRCSVGNGYEWCVASAISVSRYRTINNFSRKYTDQGVLRQFFSKCTRNFAPPVHNYLNFLY